LSISSNPVKITVPRHGQRLRLVLLARPVAVLCSHGVAERHRRVDGALPYVPNSMMMDRNGTNLYLVRRMN
jgi:hypothetical protein